MVSEWASGKESEGEAWQMAGNYMLILLLNVRIRAYWIRPWRQVSPSNLLAPTREQKTVSCPTGFSNSSSGELRQSFQLAAGREFSMKLKSKILAASDNSHRFQKGTTESEDNYQENIYQDKVSKMEERRDITES